MANFLVVIVFLGGIVQIQSRIIIKLNENKDVFEPFIKIPPDEVTEITEITIEIQVTKVPIELPVTDVPIEIPVTEVPIEVPVTEVPIEVPVTEVPIEIPLTTAHPEFKREWYKLAFEYVVAHYKEKSYSEKREQIYKNAPLPLIL